MCTRVGVLVNMLCENCNTHQGLTEPPEWKIAPSPLGKAGNRQNMDFTNNCLKTLGLLPLARGQDGPHLTLGNRSPGWRGKG